MERFAPAFLALLFIGGCAPDRAIEATRLLALFAGIEALTTDSRDAGVGRKTLVYSVNGRQYPADLYTSAHGYTAGLVLVPGLTPAGRRDKRLVAFARRLAAARFRVLVPEIPNFRELTVTVNDVAHFTHAVRFLREISPEERAVGLAAISFAAGPALIAAQTPAIRENVAFILSVGGYYDLTAVITYFTTGYFRDRTGQWQYREPNSYGKWIFVKSNAGRIGDSGDAALLNRVAARKLADPAADIADLTQRLGPHGRAVMALVTNDDPERTPSLMAELPTPVREQIRALDVSHHGLQDLRARLVLVHGRADPIIPAAESRRLAAAAPSPAHLYLLQSLEHAALGDVGILEGITIWRAIYRVLTLRDSIAAG